MFVTCSMQAVCTSANMVPRSMPARICPNGIEWSSQCSAADVPSGRDRIIARTLFLFTLQFTDSITLCHCVCGRVDTSVKTDGLNFLLYQ